MNQIVEATGYSFFPLGACYDERREKVEAEIWNVRKGTRQNLTNLINVVISDEFVSCASACHAMAARNYYKFLGGMLTAIWARLS